MFRRDPSSYGVTGLERVAPSSPSPLARQFAAACRLLGMMRTPLFQRKSGETITINVALLSPPALLLTGEVKSESPALGYHLGAMLAATMPEHVLLYGAPEAQVENVMKALLAAFGPPPRRRRRSSPSIVTTLAEMLWESMPARSQRRLRELCDDPSRIDYALARGAARQAVRRARACSFPAIWTVAVREACADLGISTWGLDAPMGLAALCRLEPGRRRSRDGFRHPAAGIREHALASDAGWWAGPVMSAMSVVLARGGAVPQRRYGGWHESRSVR